MCIIFLLFNYHLHKFIKLRIKINYRYLLSLWLFILSLTYLMKYLVIFFYLIKSMQDEIINLSMELPSDSMIITRLPLLTN